MSAFRTHLSTRERRLLWGAVSVIVAGLLYVYVVEPRASDWVQLAEDTENAMGRYQKLSVLVRNEDIIRKRYADLGKSFQSRGSESADAIALYTFLTQEGQSRDFRIRDIRPVPSRRSDAGPRLQQAVVFAEARVAGFERFLLGIINADHALAVEKLSITQPRENALLNISATITKTVRVAP